MEENIRIDTEEEMEEGLDGYEKAMDILTQFYEVVRPEGDMDFAIHKATQALRACLEMGLNGKGD